MCRYVFSSDLLQWNSKERPIKLSSLLKIFYFGRKWFVFLNVIPPLSTMSPKPPLCPVRCTHLLHGGDLPAQKRQNRSSYKPYETQRVPPSGTSKCWRYRCQSWRSKADETCRLYVFMFGAIRMNPNHVLSSFLQRLKQNQYHLRKRAYNFLLPPKVDRHFYPESFTETYTEDWVYSIIIYCLSSFTRPTTIFFLTFESIGLCLYTKCSLLF